MTSEDSKKVHILLTNEQYTLLKEFIERHDISLAFAMRFIVRFALLSQPEPPGRLASRYKSSAAEV